MVFLKVVYDLELLPGFPSALEKCFFAELKVQTVILSLLHLFVIIRQNTA